MEKPLFPFRKTGCTKQLEVDLNSSHFYDEEHRAAESSISAQILDDKCCLKMQMMHVFSWWG